MAYSPRSSYPITFAIRFVTSAVALMGMVGCGVSEQGTLQTTPAAETSPIVQAESPAPATQTAAPELTVSAPTAASTQPTEPIAAQTTSAEQAPTLIATTAAPTEAPGATAMPTASTANASEQQPTQAANSPPAPTTSADGWSTYQNQQEGFSITYPAGWTASESSADGINRTLLAPNDGGMGISIVVQAGEMPAAESTDIPNTRCEQVTVGGMSGSTCFDTISQSTTTTVVGQGKTYTFSATKLPDATIYQAILNSFTL